MSEKELVCVGGEKGNTDEIKINDDREGEI